MESITEDEEGSSKGTLNSIRTVGNGGSAGEFGTGSSKGSTVSSSIKALATSLGLKRNASKSSVPPPSDADELTQFSTPYSALPPAASLPQTDHFTFTPSRLSSGTLAEVIPGHALRPGVPAPENARLSLGTGAPVTLPKKQPTTTIRLISNPLSNVDGDISYGAGDHGTPQLKPFKTTFDLILGSPSSNTDAMGLGAITRWPPNDADELHSGLYPKLTMHDLPPSSFQRAHDKGMARDEDGDVIMNEDLEPLALPSPRSPSLDENQLKPPSGPFIFGSPHPRYSVSNDEFRSAASNVLEEMNKRLQEQGVDGVNTELINRLKPGAHTGIDFSVKDIDIVPTAKQAHFSKLFNKAHEQEFKKMEGIDEFLRRRSPSKKEDQSLQIGKRKSSVLGTGAGRDAHGRRIPGAHVGRVSATRVISGARRSRVIPDDEDEPVQDRDENKMNTEEDSLPTTRKKEKGRGREFGEMQKEREGRQSKESNQTSAKPSRFGFLASAKSMVKSVWNRGKTAAPSQPSNLTKANEKDKPSLSTKIPAVAPVRPAIPSSSTQPPVIRTQKERQQDVAKGTASSNRSRSPLPSFGTATSTKSSVAPVGTSRSSRNSSFFGHSRNGSASSKVGALGGSSTSSRTSAAGVSSLGARSAATRTSTLPGTLGSMGMKKVPISRTDSTSSKRMSSISSRLMAPTASSLAKMQRPSTMNIKDAADNHSTKITAPQSRQSEALGAITNNPAMKSPKSFPPTPGKIFSTPLEFRSGIPTPVKKSAASPLAGEMSAASPPTSQPSANTSGVIRQKTLSGRKPRISRSKVIAKLASQRAAATSGPAVLTPRVASGTGKMRSSLGAKAQRARRSGGSDVLMSAKKRARQSEYARRRSRASKAEADE
ncbi:hypothetical protein BDQ17DRAFT_1345178 [Cyathus striatus]|nr:hypothetical protein BDQ17DRAFT_1345178 [Cyathus striatus]